MIRTVTIEREYGAGGGGIAQSIADRLGWKLRDHDLTTEIARLAQVDQAAVVRVDERCDSLFYRSLKRSGACVKPAKRHLMIKAKMGDDVVVRTVLDKIHDLDVRTPSDSRSPQLTL